MKVTRVLPAREKPCGPCLAPAPVMKSRLTVTGPGLGFCTRTKVSMPPSVEPSARYQAEAAAMSAEYQMSSCPVELS